MGRSVVIDALPTCKVCISRFYIMFEAFWQKRMTVAVLLVVLLFNFGSFSPEITRAETLAPIKLGMSAAFSGPSEALGRELYQGAMAYINQKNSRGGIKGHKLVIVAYDDGYNPDPMIRNTIKLVEDDDVLALFGYVGTPTTTRVLPLLKYYDQKNILLLFPFTGAQPMRQPPNERHIFNLRGSYFHETKELVDNFVAMGRRRIGVFYQIDSYGRSGWDGVRRALKKHDLSIVGESTYRRGASFEDSMEKQVAILQRNNPDAVISVGSYSACAAFIRDARNSGWEVPIANLSFVNFDRMVQILKGNTSQHPGKYTVNLINSQVVPNYENLSLPAVREYREAMERGEISLPDSTGIRARLPVNYSSTSFEGFLNAKLLCAVLETMNDPTDRRELRNAFESLTNYDIGIGRPVSFSPDNHQGLNEVYFVTISDGGISSMTEAHWQQMQQ